MSLPISPGDIVLNEREYPTAQLTLRELMDAVLVIMTETDVSTTEGQRYDPAYLIESVMLYLVTGDKSDLKRVTADHGLRAGAEELRKRFLSGEWSGRRFIS